jgi:hypothetical protein
MKFKVQRYELYETEIEADSPEDAAILIKYRAFTTKGWLQVGGMTYRLVNPDKKVIQIDDNKS